MSFHDKLISKINKLLEENKKWNLREFKKGLNSSIVTFTKY